MTQKSKKSLQNRVFTQTLSGLSSSELKTFKAFCNQSSSISDKTKSLFEYIYKAAPYFEKLTEDKILSRFFSNNPKAKSLLNYAFHDLSELLRKWLIQKEVEADETLQNQLFIRACKKRFLHQQFFKKMQQTLEALENDFLPIPDTWHKLFETNFNLFYHVHTPKNQEEIESLSDMETYLEMFYHGSKIRLFCQHINRRRTFKNLPEIDGEELRSTLDFAEKHGRNIPFFTLYAQLIQYLQKPEKRVFEQFINNFKRDRKQLDRLDQSILFYTALYSLNDSTIKGDKTTLQTQFDLFKYAFGNDLAMFDNEMDKGPFNNFLLAACMLGEFKIAKKMLKKYEPFFNPTIRTEFTNLMWCTVFYYEKKYDKVELSLHNFQFKNALFRIRSRNLLLKSLYERFQKDANLKAVILSELVKLRKYIEKQNGISELRKSMYYDMIFVIRKLTNTRHTRLLSRAKAKQELTNFLSAKSNKPVSKKWLSEKIKEL